MKHPTHLNACCTFSLPFGATTMLLFCPLMNSCMCDKWLVYIAYDKWLALSLSFSLLLEMRERFSEFDNLPPHTCKGEKSVASFWGVISGIRASCDVGRIFE